VTTLEDLEARVAAINVLGANQREHSTKIVGLDSRQTAVEHRLDSLAQEVRDGRRSNEEHFAELKDLIIAGRDS